MNELQLELTKLIGKKELTSDCFVEAITVDGEGLNQVSYKGRFLYEVDEENCAIYTESGALHFNYSEIEIIGHPATLSDLHRWMNEKGIKFRQFNEELQANPKWIESSYEYIHQFKIQYDSSKELLEQDSETLEQIKELIKTYQ